jgi:hypothetical protein
MKPTSMDVLVSGASVARPTAAYGLRRYGFNPRVVERTPAVRVAQDGRVRSALPNHRSDDHEDPHPPKTAVGVASPELIRLVMRLPVMVQRKLLLFQRGSARALDAIALERYEPIRRSERREGRP